MNAPAFQFYAADFLADAAVMAMTYEERGVYITLLALGWREGSIPADRSAQARLLKLSKARMERIWPALTSRFVPASQGGWLVNPRLERERQRQANWRDKSSKGGRSKRQPYGNQIASDTPLLPPKGGASLQSSSSSSSASSGKTGSTPLVGFDQFKTIYPRRENWPEAEKAWRQVGASPHLVAIVADVQRRLESHEWEPRVKDRRRFIPMPASYLRARRWEDEPALEMGTGVEEDPYAGQPHLWDCTCGDVHEGVRGQPRPPCPNGKGQS
jgi:uncharacterized protein YdaU (DUF1376 family)